MPYATAFPVLESILIMHVAVLGYWLGAELVINRSFRYVTRSHALPFPERARLLDHVMVVDQHVRYALALQLGLGMTLSSLLGYLPGGALTTALALLAMIALLVLVEVSHRLRRQPSGPVVARLDRAIRVLIIAGCATLAWLSLVGAIAMPAWLGLKTLLFAAVIGCGLAIRYALLGYFADFSALEHRIDDNRLEDRLWAGYVRATAILVVLWVCIGAITLLSVVKPGLRILQ